MTEAPNPQVTQAAERIIFAQGEDGEVTAVIQILYEGPADEFAWLLPVEGQPEVSVSSDAAFTALQGATDPSYTLTRSVEGTCRQFTGGGGGGCAAFAASDGFAAFDAGFATSDSAPPINVLDAGNVGPYDYVILSVSDTAEDVAAEAQQWLSDNGYEVSELGVDRLRPYLEGGMNLLAFRLTKGTDTGSIRPVRLSFGQGVPSIPIRPTAAAASADMGVMVWVLGGSRAIPANYASLELNEAAINWFNPGPTYDAVVSQAANEAGGQGFVTEMAGDASPLGDTIFPSGRLDRFREIEARDWTNGQDLLVRTLINEYSDLDGIRDVVATAVELDGGRTVDEYITGLVPLTLVEDFDWQAFVVTAREQMIDPMNETARLFRSHAWVTRFYTTMSADEMTLDPAFDFNADLPAVDNVHTANQVTECSPTVWQNSAPWRVELQSGDVVRGTGFGWPFLTTDRQPIPATRLARRVGTEGTGEVMLDNRELVRARIQSQNRTVPSPTGALTVRGSLVPASVETALILGVQNPTVLLLGLAGAALLFRRRRD